MSLTLKIMAILSNLILCYITCDHKLKEMFLDFIEIQRITGKALV